MRYELWRTYDQSSVTFIFVEADSVEVRKQRGEIEPGAERIWSVDADSIDEAMTLYHEFMGWEPYIPMDG